MSAVKERIFGAVTAMSEADAIKFWEIIKMQFCFNEVEPTEDEIRVVNAYKNGDDEYQPYISHGNLKKEFGLE